MANPLPQESELYVEMKNGKISIDPGMMDFLYHYIGDDITAITLLCQYYLTNNEPIPLEQAERILIYTRDIEMIINSVTKASTKDNFPFPQFKFSIPLNHIIRDLLTYHFGNDVYVINLVVYDALNVVPPCPRQISINSTQKIIERAKAIKIFLAQLLSAVCN